MEGTEGRINREMEEREEREGRGGMGGREGQQWKLDLLYAAKNIIHTSGISGRSLAENPLLDWRMERREVNNTNNCGRKFENNIEIKSFKLYLVVSHSFCIVTVLCCVVSADTGLNTSLYSLAVFLYRTTLPSFL